MPARPRSIPRLRAVVTDVDGTITDGHRRLHLGAVDRLRQISAAGRPVILATGNVLPIALALHRFLGLNGPIVAENGGLIYRRDGDRERVERVADQRVALDAYRRLRRAGLPVRRLFTDRWRETEVALEPTVPERRLRAVLAGRPVLVEGTGFAHHLMQRGVGKLPALRRALAPLGLQPSDCLVLGDGDNDVAMLRAAGWAVSFPGGSRRARSAADYVTRADHGDGFVEAVIHAGVVPARSPGGGA